MTRRSVGKDAGISPAYDAGNLKALYRIMNRVEVSLDCCIPFSSGPPARTQAWRTILTIFRTCANVLYMPSMSLSLCP